MFDWIKSKERELHLARLRNRLENKNPSIIAYNCVGTTILHDLKCRFNTPTINLGFEADDFIKFLGDLEHYLSVPVVECETDRNHPVGKIDDITLLFAHYDTFEEAKQKWEERRTRVDFDNLYIIMTDQGEFTDEHAKAFNELPYRHKVLLTARDYPQYECAYQLKRYASEKSIRDGDVIYYVRKGLWRRGYEEFDYVGFLNQK